MLGRLRVALLPRKSHRAFRRRCRDFVAPLSVALYMRRQRGRERRGTKKFEKSVLTRTAIRVFSRLPDAAQPERGPAPGGVAERLKAPVLKTGKRKLRGFESHLLRSLRKILLAGSCLISE